MSRNPPPPKKTSPALWATGIIFFVTLICYLPALGAGFIWDDDAMLTDNPFVKHPGGLWRLWFTTAPTDYWPLTYTSFWLEWRLWGMNPTGYHVTNILLHAGSAVLLWRVLKRLAVPGAWFAALIFAVHPVNVESVAWITERKNTLCLCFGLLALLWYLRFDMESSPRRKWYWLAVLAFGLSLLAKTATVALPVVLVLYHWWHSRSATNLNPNLKNIALRLAPFFLLSLAMGLATIWFQSNRAIGADVIREDNLLTRFVGAGWAVWFYLYKAVLPLNLSFVYPQWEINAGSIIAWLPLGALVGLLAGLWKYRSRWGASALFGLGSFLLLLAPVLGFINVYFHRYSLVADHWQYFALIGIVAWVVGGGATWLNRREAAASPKQRGAWLWRGRAVGAVVVIGLGVLTWKQTLVYANSETLWRDTLKKNPRSWLALNNLGLIAVARGDLIEAKSLHLQSLALKPSQIEAHNNLGEIYLLEGKVPDAREQYLAALKINPNFAMTHYNLGNVLDREGHRDEAMVSYRRALELLPDYPDAHNNLGCMLALQGKRDEAIAHFQQALRLRWDYTDALNNLGSTLVDAGRAAEAMEHLDRALQQKPDYADAHYNRGNALLALKRPREAFAEYQATVQLNPQHAWAHFKVGNLLLADRIIDGAEPHYQAALRASPNFPEAHYQLATILSGRKQTSEAVEHFRAAIRFRPDWVEALNNLAWIYATSADAKLRDGKQAVELAAHAVSLTRTNDAGVLDTLAAGYAARGDFAAAIRVSDQALKLAGPQEQLAGEIRTRAESYRANRPHRE